MESAALFISIVGVLLAGGSTIIAWVARGDALKAEGRADASEKAALKAAKDAVDAHRGAASSLAGINAFIASEPERARRRAACFAMLTTFFDLVSVPGQGRDMWHSSEHHRFIDATKQALFDLGSKSDDSRGISLTREAFDALRDLQVRGVWDESICSAVKGVVGGVWEELSVESKSEGWWADRRSELLSKLPTP